MAGYVKLKSTPLTDITTTIESVIAVITSGSSKKKKH